MKKILLVLSIIAVLTVLTACKNEKTEEPVNQPNTVVETSGEPAVEPNTDNSGEEIAVQPTGVGNTDESMIVLVLEDYFLNTFSGDVEEINVQNVHVYSPDEIAESKELFEKYNLQEGDIAFDATYELKIYDGKDVNPFTAGTGEPDGQWVRNKSNVGIARSGENGYTLDVTTFGTAF